MDTTKIKTLRVANSRLINRINEVKHKDAVTVATGEENVLILDCHPFPRATKESIKAINTKMSMYLDGGFADMNGEIQTETKLTEIDMLLTDVIATFLKSGITTVTLSDIVSICYGTEKTSGYRHARQSIYIELEKLSRIRCKIDATREYLERNPNERKKGRKCIIYDYWLNLTTTVITESNGTIYEAKYEINSLPILHKYSDTQTVSIPLRQMTDSLDGTSIESVLIRRQLLTKIAIMKNGNNNYDETKIYIDDHETHRKGGKMRPGLLSSLGYQIGTAVSDNAQRQRRKQLMKKIERALSDFQAYDIIKGYTPIHGGYRNKTIVAYEITI